MLLGFVFLYLLITIGIGLWAARRVKNTADFAIAGRHLPLIMIVTTTFATWFGSETVLGIGAKLVQGNLGSVVEDPFGSAFCLIFVGLFFAAKLYKHTLLTISDYYRQRFGKQVEILCSIMIMLSYLGWVAAQVTALGLVFNILSAGAISFEWGMVIGVASILIYTLFGGMWSVAITDFVQMIVLVVGLSIIAVLAADMAGGADKVMAYAQSKDMLKFLPAPNLHDIVFFFAAAITIMLGSIPQQDIFQRVMSAKDLKAATRGPIIGGVAYLLFAFVPVFLVVAAIVIMPEKSAEFLKGDSQRILPTLVLEKMPFFAQIIFFGALLSAIKSTASATLLAPSVTFVENIYKHMVPRMTDEQTLKAMRVTVLLFSMFVLGYAMLARGKPIYDMVSGAYQITLVGAFVPLVFGLYWKRATTQGAIASIVLGIGTWLLVIIVPGWSEAFPQQLAGVIAALAGMIVGSLATQKIANHTGHVQHFVGSEP
jgi:solute:Na+ symporter, SSS family